MPSSQETGIHKLLDNRKVKAALDAAKDFHKATGTAASESLLIECYTARIRSLFDQNLALEGKSLLELVRHRYPAAKTILDRLEADLGLQSNSIGELLKPLNDPALAPDRRTAIETEVRQRVWDLAALAACESLPVNHPLRAGAAALDRCFKAVTSGPVSEEQLALPEISRRSPLAPWKILVRAIVAFHQGDDPKCRESLDALDPESAPARLIPVLRAMLDNHKHDELAPAAAALSAQINGGMGALRKAIDAVDRALTDDGDKQICKAVRALAVEVKKMSPTLGPQLWEDMRRRICARGLVAEVDGNALASALEGRPPRSAEFSRVLARAHDLAGADEFYPLASFMWNGFREDAIHERWIPAGGVEEAAVYLHMAETLLLASPETLLSAQRHFSGGPTELDSLFPERMFQRACDLDPHTAAFSKWLGWAKRQSVAMGEEAAKAWSAALPGDIEPLLYQMEQVELRKAFPKALRFLESAERINAVNPEVRAARLRLLGSGAMNQLRKGKPQLAERELVRMAALPEARQGDRPAFIAALRCLIASELRDEVLQAASRREMARIFGNEIAGDVLLYSIQANSRLLPQLFPPVKSLAVEARTALLSLTARLSILVAEFRIEKFYMPHDFILEMTKQLEKSPAPAAALPTGQLELVADFGVRVRSLELVYHASRAGLGRGEETDGRFLLLHAKSLPERLVMRRNFCASAAATLGRLHRDLKLVDQAVEFLRHPYGLEPLPLTPEQTKKIIRREKAAVKYPTDRFPGPDYSDLVPRKTRRPDPVFEEPLMFEEPLIDDGVLKNMFEEEIRNGMPREVADRMLDLLDQAGKEGIPPQVVMNELFGSRGGKNRKRKR